MKAQIYVRIAFLVALLAMHLFASAQSVKMPDPINEIYEESDGLHVVLNDYQIIDGQKVYDEILIELQDETDTYYFEVDGWQYEIKYFRKGSARRGTTGVFVVLFDQLYRIDSHRLNHSTFATH